MTGDGPGSELDRVDAWRASALGALALAIRVVYLLRLDVPAYDPWRHLALVRNVREGLGFTLFDGQPYLWYSPIWYVLCALAPPSLGPQWIACLFSVLAVPALYLVGRRLGGRTPATVAALLLAACGPVVAFTCHYGPEALALALVTAAVALVAVSGAWSATAAGALLGVAIVLRSNLALNLLLAAPWLRDRRRTLGFCAGTATPLALTWWRNHRILATHPWVFTWDGLATRSADFGWLSTFVVQMHPAVQEGLRRLHEAVVPRPEWLIQGGRPNWPSIVFLATGIVCTIVARRASLALAGLLPLVYFLFLDRSLSANFFRIYLGVFPAMFLAIGLVAARLFVRRERRWLAVALVLLPILGGAALLAPPRMGSLEALTPDASLLGETRYFVPSGGFYPESLIWKFPDRSFLGLPLDPNDLPEFLAAYPAYRAVLLHDFTVQPEVERTLLEDPSWHVSRTALTSEGRVYRVLERGP
jgi:hypothetical protein